MIRKTTVAAALVMGLIANGPVSSTQARDLDSVSFEHGRGNEDTEVWRVGLQRKWPHRWFAERAWTLGAYWDLQVGRWAGPHERGQRDRGDDEVWDLSFTPVFRLERAARTRFAPYAEAAIGFHMLSDLRINFRRIFTTHFQFGDHLGFGARFGPAYRYDAQLRLQHLSNGGIARPNPGINFWQVRVAYHFD